LREAAVGVAIIQHLVCVKVVHFRGSVNYCYIAWLNLCLMCLPCGLSL
jgi:hypothetical protein